MKAVLCKAFGPADTLVVEDVSSPEIKKMKCCWMYMRPALTFLIL